MKYECPKCKVGIVYDSFKVQVCKSCRQEMTAFEAIPMVGASVNRFESSHFVSSVALNETS